MRSARPAFTYLELLAILVILGILAAIVIRRLPAVEEPAVQSTVRTNLHRVRTQLEIYFNRHRRYPARLQELIEQGYLEQEPPHPGRGSYVYDAEAGTFRSTLNEAW